MISVDAQFRNMPLSRVFYALVGGLMVVLAAVSFYGIWSVSQTRAQTITTVEVAEQRASALDKNQTATARTIPDIPAPTGALIALIVIVGQGVLGGAVAVWFLRRLTIVPMLEVVGKAKAAAAGDLSVEATRTLGNEVGDLQEAFGDMISSIRDVVGQIDVAAIDLQTASSEMVMTSDEAGRAIGEVARSVSSIAEGASHQVDLITSTQDVVAEIERSVADTAENARAAQAESEETRVLAQDGVKRAVEMQRAMESVRESAESSAAVVRTLGQKSQDIDKIIQTITSIAGQTNLLALNAAIEAARAGEQGRGFAVVADEVRELAENSQSAAGSIGKLISEIQSETDKAVQAMEEGVVRVERGTAIVDLNKDTFFEIQQAVDHLHGRSSEIAAAAEQLARGTDRIREQIEDVASVAEQSSASTEEVSASTEQTSASAQQVTANAQGVAQTAVGLAELVGRFKLRQ